jgi:hypothetical protein
MRRRAVQLICAWAWLGLISPGLAQEGHPLTGTWSGDWGPTPSERHHLTLVMNWDGERVTGLINPGPDGVPIGTVVVDVTDWTVRIEAEAISAEGRLDDIGSYHRTLSGAWRQGATAGDFTLTRD